MARRLTITFSSAFITAIGLAAFACLQATAAAAQTPPAAPCVRPEEAPAPPPAPGPPPPPAAYVVGRSDVLHISVSPDMSLDSSGRCSNDYTVGADGAINFCMLGAVKVEGLTERGIDTLIRTQLQERGFYTNASVTTEVKTYRSQSVYVSGEVRTPGQQPLAGNQMTLMHAINAAGGWTPQSGPDVFILRPRKNESGATAPVTLDDSTAEKVVYSRKALLTTFDDPPVQDGDTIVVSQAELYFINGQVNSPGQKVWEPCTTVGDAIAMAGGYTEKASLRRSHIQRKNAKGTFDRIGRLKPETPLLPRDVLVIGRSLF